MLANYIERQKALRAFDVLGEQPDRELTDDVLMGYIARGSLGGGNGALSAIASFTAPVELPREPELNSSMLSRYIDDGFQPTAKRVETANAERGCLAQAIYHEARGESEAGQMAVANVIVNRALSGKYPSTLCGVIYQNANKGRYRCQFTFACDGKDDAPRRTPRLEPFHRSGRHGLCQLRDRPQARRAAAFGAVLPHHQCEPVLVQYLQPGRPDRLAHLLFAALMAGAQASVSDFRENRLIA